MNYSEKLKDPRWQRKRLEVLQREDFTCETCKAIEKTLHVHHKFYETGKEPWEYPLEAFMVLCVDCHEEEESEKQYFKEMVVNVLKSGFTYGQLNTYLHGLYGPPVDFDKSDRVDVARFVAMNLVLLEEMKVRLDDHRKNYHLEW